MKTRILLCLLIGPLLHAASTPDGYSTKKDIEGYLNVRNDATGKKLGLTMAKFVEMYGDAEIYQSVLTTEFENEMKKGGHIIPQKPKQGFQGLKVRESASDVLAVEDPTLETQARKKKDDIKGASLSYNRNFRSDTDTWIGKAAVILPFKWNTNAEYFNSSPMTLMSYGLIPSVTLNQLESTDPKQKEIDQLLYRAGAFATLYGPQPYLTELNLRGYATYGTNLDHDLKIGAFEFEVEPRWDIAPRVAIGYRKSIIDRDIALAGQAPNYEKNSYLAYQARMYLKGAAGDIAESAEIPDVNEGSFFRVGPAFELKFDPFFHEKLSISCSYRYLFAIEGSDQNNSLFEAGVEWMLFGSKEEGKVVSLKASYIEGGLDLTQQETETVLLGLGVTF